MARKKKVMETAPKSDIITYKGSVTIKRMKGNTLIHKYKLNNNGTNQFFFNLCKSLIGEPYKTPRYLAVGTGQGATQVGNTGLRDEYLLNGDTMRSILTPLGISFEESSYVVKWTTSVSSIGLGLSSVTNFTEVGLFESSSGENLLARVETSFEEVLPFSTINEYVGYFVKIGNDYTLVTEDNKNDLGIIAGTTPAYYNPFVLGPGETLIIEWTMKFSNKE